MIEEKVGNVTDYFARPVVAAVDLTGNLKVGDRIHIKGYSTDMDLVVSSMQINNVSVPSAKAGDSIGIKVNDRVRKGDDVYKVVE